MRRTRTRYVAGYYRLTRFTTEYEHRYFNLTAEQARVLFRTPRRTKHGYPETLVYKLGFHSWELLEERAK